MNYPKAAAFDSRRIPGLACRFITATAITGIVAGDQCAVVGPDIDSAMRSARNHFGPRISRDGAQSIVLIDAGKFHELLRMAGIQAEPISQPECKAGAGRGMDGGAS